MWEQSITNKRAQVEAFDWKVYHSKQYYSYALIFSEKYSFLLNLLRQKINILGALQIFICFLAGTKSLHLGQYQRLSSPKISSLENISMHSSILILGGLQLCPAAYLELSVCYPNYSKICSTSFSCFLQYISISMRLSLENSLQGLYPIQSLKSQSLQGNLHPLQFFFLQYEHVKQREEVINSNLMGYLSSSKLASSSADVGSCSFSMILLQRWKIIAQICLLVILTFTQSSWKGTMFLRQLQSE